MTTLALPRAAAVVLAAAVVSSAQQPLFKELHRMLPTDSTDPGGVSVGDVDGDGDRDLLFANAAGEETARLLLNDGTGAFVAASPGIASPPERVFDAALTDVDGDGDLDALLGLGNYDPVGEPIAAQNRLHLNDGAGGFGHPAPGLPALKDFTRHVDVGDLDGDGDVDAIFGNAAMTSGFPPVTIDDRLLFNDGAGVFSDASAGIPIIGGSNERILLEDLDADGDLDVLRGGPNFFRNDGTGFFTPVPGVFPGASFSLGWALADVDGDGDSDAVTGKDVFRNDGSAAFSLAPGALPPLAASSVVLSTAPGDADGDGDVDVLLAARVGFLPPDTYLFLNDGSGVFSDASSGVAGVGPEQLLLADLDGDLDLDAVASLDGQDELLLNDGAGVFVEAADEVDVGGGQALAVLDVNGDAIPDLLLGSLGDTLHLGDGTGGFEAQGSALLSVGDTTLAIGLADVDGDGDADALLGKYSQNRLLLNDGAGLFSDASAALPTASAHSEDLALADLDGDGDVDALVANSNTKNFLYRNDGTGVFADASADLHVLPSTSFAVDVADIDGDGDLDALLGNSGQNHLYFNNGLGVLTPWPAFSPIFTTSATAAKFGDLDRDGDPDAVLGLGSDLDGDLVVLNSGDGFVWAFPDADFGDDIRTEDLGIGDLDGDGDLDVVLANQAYQFGLPAPKGLQLGDGKGGFVSSPELFDVNSIEPCPRVALSDLDGDGDLDAVFSSWKGQSVRIFANQSRQVAWAGVPRLGKPYTLDVRGPAAEPWFLAWSLGEASYALPPYGVLHLNPASVLVVHASGFLDAAGHASSTLVAPGDPAFAGATVYWQGLVGLPLKFTNLERTTFVQL